MFHATIFAPPIRSKYSADDVRILSSLTIIESLINASETLHDYTSYSIDNNNYYSKGIRNGDVISVGTNSFMYGQSSLRVSWVLVTQGYGLRISLASQNSYNFYTNLQSLGT